MLFLSSTVMVPLGNLIFTLPFMPGHTPMQDSDIAGLLLIMSGLVVYRFGNAVYFQCSVSGRRNNAISPPTDEKSVLGDYAKLSDSADLSMPLLNPVV